MNDQSKRLTLVSTRRPACTRLNALEESPVAERSACPFDLRSSYDSPRTRVKYWSATGAFWGGAWGLLCGPTLFYSATGTGLGADVKQAFASLICGAAGTMVGAAFAGFAAMLTRRRVRSMQARPLTSSGLRIVDINEARAYGLYSDHRPMHTTSEEQEQ
ncbi:hypothetical protein [Paraburkholderia terrae]|uniref:Transmembrane protein n=1 Tax=Paraburkholderia terrae TaxID=311230 RepID=A0A2I8EYP1_9BURK|nr:hypothetical protein [Paraburkholderia terrae]AUT64620.1 hypothetical protein C2L65_33755 [Paraburkholderia terrae]